MTQFLFETCDIKNINTVLQQHLEDKIFARGPLHIKFSRTETRELNCMWLKVDGELYMFHNSKRLGQGATGTVYMMEDFDHHVAFAVKESITSNDMVLSDRLIEQNCDVLKSRYVGYGEDSYWKDRVGEERLYLFIMELADGDMTHLLDVKKASMSAHMAVQVVEKLRQQMLCLFNLTPDREYAYCDVKLQNIFYKCAPGNLQDIRVFLGDLESAVPVQVSKLEYNYNSTHSPPEGSRVRMYGFESESSQARRRGFLSWNIGIALLSMTMFFTNIDVGRYLVQYVNRSEIQEELRRKNLLVPHEVIQKYVTNQYQRVGHRFGDYLQDLPGLRPRIDLPLVAVSTPIVVLSLIHI